MSAKNFASEGIKLTNLHISLKLTIPGFRIKCGIPLTKDGQFVGRELFNRCVIASDLLMEDLFLLSAGGTIVLMRLSAPDVCHRPSRTCAASRSRESACH